MSNKTEAAFRYSIFTKEPFCIIIFEGSMGPEASETIAQCRQDMLGKRALGIKYVVLHMADLDEAQGESIRQLILLQGTIRTLSAELRISGLQPSVKERLIKERAMRPSEFVSDILGVPLSWGLTELVLSALLERQG